MRGFSCPHNSGGKQRKESANAEAEVLETVSGALSDSHRGCSCLFGRYYLGAKYWHDERQPKNNTAENRGYTRDSFDYPCFSTLLCDSSRRKVAKDGVSGLRIRLRPGGR